MFWKNHSILERAFQPLSPPESNFTPTYGAVGLILDIYRISTLKKFLREFINAFACETHFLVTHNAVCCRKVADFKKV